MSVTTEKTTRLGVNFLRPVWCEDGRCPNDKSHFRGAAREVYTYLKLLAARNDGFVFATVRNITAHTKKWADHGKPFSERHVRRILRTFQKLGILSTYESRMIKARNFFGWELYSHDDWAEIQGGLCEFKRWEPYQLSQ